MRRTIGRLAGLLLLSGVASRAYGASPIEISECRLIAKPGTYRLVRDLSSAGDCLVIKADRVMIDLGGFRIIGKGRGRAISGDASEVSIQNGTVTGFGDGIALRGQALIERMRVAGNAQRGITVTEMAVVKDSAVSQNREGIRVGAHSVLMGNTVTDNLESGIISSQVSTIIGNTVSGNGLSGVAALADSTVIDNVVSRNAGYGLGVVCPSNVIGNVSSENGRNVVLDRQGCNMVSNATD
jgi:hypothetical protein